MRIRTIETAYQEIKENDPNTAITKYRIRDLLVNGVIPATKSGTKWVFDLDLLVAYYEGKGVA